MGPNMVLAARKTERVVRERVRRFASAPLAGMRNQDPNNYSDANRGCLVYLGGQKRRQNLVAHRPWKQPLKPQEVW